MTVVVIPRRRTSPQARCPSCIVTGVRKYQYVGSKNIRDIARGQPAGTVIRNSDDLASWLEESPTEQTPDDERIATFTICECKLLRLAPRRSEHVACASGGPVLSAGEVTFDTELSITGMSNQSTGFCPEAESWPIVQSVLDRIGLKHPGQFTHPVVFRLCPKCGQRNIVKDAWYYCQLCDAKLPESWNFPRSAG